MDIYIYLYSEVRLVVAVSTAASEDATIKDSNCELNIDKNTKLSLQCHL